MKLPLIRVVSFSWIHIVAIVIITIISGADCIHHIEKAHDELHLQFLENQEFASRRRGAHEGANKSSHKDEVVKAHIQLTHHRVAAGTSCNASTECAIGICDSLTSICVIRCNADGNECIATGQTCDPSTLLCVDVALSAEEQAEDDLSAEAIAKLEENQAEEEIIDRKFLEAPPDETDVVSGPVNCIPVFEGASCFVLYDVVIQDGVDGKKLIPGTSYTGSPIVLLPAGTKLDDDFPVTRPRSNAMDNAAPDAVVDERARQEKERQDRIRYIEEFEKKRKNDAVEQSMVGITETVYVDADGNPWKPELDVTIQDDASGTSFLELYEQERASVDFKKVHHVPLSVKNLEICFEILPEGRISPISEPQGDDPPISEVNKRGFKFLPISEDRQKEVIEMAYSHNSQGYSFAEANFVALMLECMQKEEIEKKAAMRVTQMSHSWSHLREVLEKYRLSVADAQKLFASQLRMELRRKEVENSLVVDDANILDLVNFNSFSGNPNIYDLAILNNWKSVSAKSIEAVLFSLILSLPLTASHFFDTACLGSLNNVFFAINGVANMSGYGALVLILKEVLVISWSVISSTPWARKLLNKHFDKRNLSGGYGAVECYMDYQCRRAPFLKLEKTVCDNRPDGNKIILFIGAATALGLAGAVFPVSGPIAGATGLIAHTASITGINLGFSLGLKVFLSQIKLGEMLVGGPPGTYTCQKARGVHATCSWNSACETGVCMWGRCSCVSKLVDTVSVSKNYYANYEKGTRGCQTGSLIDGYPLEKPYTCMPVSRFGNLGSPECVDIHVQGVDKPFNRPSVEDISLENGEGEIIKANCMHSYECATACCYRNGWYGQGQCRNINPNFVNTETGPEFFPLYNYWYGMPEWNKACIGDKYPKCPNGTDGECNKVGYYCDQTNKMCKHLGLKPCPSGLDSECSSTDYFCDTAHWYKKCTHISFKPSSGIGYKPCPSGLDSDCSKNADYYCNPDKVCMHLALSPIMVSMLMFYYLLMVYH